MKKIHWIFALLLLLLAGACTDTLETPDTGDGDVPEGMVRMRIAPGMIDQSVVVTRATGVPPGAGEKKINNSRILVFDKDPALSLAGTALTQPPATGTWNNAEGLLDVLLYEETGVQRYICIVANLSAASIAWLDTQDAGTTYSTIQQRLLNTLPTSGAIRINPASLPLSGWMANSVEIKKGPSGATTLNPSNTPAVTLGRGVARIDVNATLTTSAGGTFTITGAAVANCPRTGTHLPDLANKLTAWDITSVASCDLQRLAVAGTLLQEMVYSYEYDGAAGSSAEHPLRIIISGIRAGTTTESFYGIDLVYAPDPAKPDKKSMEIHRNYIYTIYLKKVAKDGYATYQEAARAASFNSVLDADITVTDPYAHDIVTNGRQYLGVTNTEYVLYPFDGNTSTNLAIASFAYTCDPAWMAGKITLPTGISLPAGTQQSLSVSSYVTQRDLVVDIAPTFTSGIITLHIGNLKKEIKVRRMIPTSANGGAFSNYYEGAPASNSDLVAAFKEYKIGEVINFSPATGWLKVATTSDVSGEAALSNRVVTGLGGIYVHVANNFSYDASGVAVPAMPREASIYLSGDTQGERMRVHVQQLSSDLYQNITKIKPFSYVGAFWRANQTGERLIRMFGLQNADGTGISNSNFWWQADVVSGQDWIVMDTKVTSDANVHVYQGPNGNPYGIGDNSINGNYGDAVEQFQVDSKLRTVRGTSTYIYFRIGLTGQLSGAAAAPRYGLIMISFGSTLGKVDGYHPLYIRQGEAADYLMRPFDPITRDPKATNNNPQLPSRPKAVKVSPFNLDTEKTSTGYIDLGYRGGIFAPFPSVGGVYQQAMSTKVTLADEYYVPVLGNAGIAAGGILSAETCPKGYRRISDVTPVTVYDNINVPNQGLLASSEMRQSIMLFPTQGGDNNSNTNQNAMTNQYQGYLADGYFDRQAIVTANNYSSMGGVVDPQIRACVREAKIGQAFQGILFFNPYNYASLFFPSAGSYGTGGGAGSRGTVGRGQFAPIWTGSQFNGSQTWTLWVGSFSTVTDVTQLYYSSNDFGNSIRCVRDENPLIESGGELGQPGSGTTIDGINRDPDPDNQSDISARYLYTGTGTLQSQLEAKYTTAAKRMQIGSMVISGDKPLTATDYAYLNAWADNPSYNLRHLDIHGNSTTGNTSIPAGAFTSGRWITIGLKRDISTIQDGAFSTGLTGLKTLTVDYLDLVTASNGASGAFRFDASKVSLRLNGFNMTEADLSAKTWKGLTWYSIHKNN